jgi:ATP-dependent Lhr-like helicase
MDLGGFSLPVREWFATSFPEPTPAQAQGWPAIAQGDHTLILAPTGSGKTLAAFLWGLDRLSTEPPPDERTTRTRLLYISPLRALAVDVERNLRAPLAGIALAAERLGHSVQVPTVGMRTGDTAADERRALVRHPPDVLITTPESLFLMLTSRARETLAGVRWVIVDEIHALAATKRGAHLSLSMERLEHLVVGAGGMAPQRVGLSATQRPLDEIARFLGGRDTSPDRWRPVTIVDAGRRKAMEVEVVVPVEDLSRMGEVLDEPVSGPTAAGPARASIWPSVHPKLLELIHSHRSTLVFVNSRRLAERLAARLNELDAANQEGEEPRHTSDEQMGTGGDLVRAHHGSLSREQRLDIEDQLKAGRLRALVATSSLELGIDMGAIDLVVQVESPGSVASGLQRIGRAGHRVGEPSRGKIFPKHRGDLVEAAVVVRRMGEGLIEETRYPRNPLDVLAQQVVAACALDEWRVDDLAALVRRSANFADLTPDALASVLDLLAGRYPSEEFAELRPRIVWDRQAGVVRGRSGAQRVAVTNAGTIPDRGLFGVFLPDGARVGELDEEMVYESRVGETFLLGASTWRITEIGYDRVVVVPAPGEPGKMPFWHGDKPGRPLELGRAIGAFVREVAGTLAAGGDDGAGRAAAVEALQADYALDAWAADNLARYVADQAEATGVVPDDRTVVVERFRDEIGDWRICILSPFGARVHAPWAMALEARLASKLGMDVQTIWSDDGIVLRLPESEDHIPLDEVALDPDEVEELVISALPGTALFAARFRENAARSLLLPRRRPGSRTPLWQQRQRAADLLRVAARYPSFPLLLETTRECLADVFDLTALRAVLSDLRSGRAKVVAVDTDQASPFASSLLFGWVAVYMYEGDAPLAERRAAALALDRDLLRELLGAEELRELIDPAALADLELELQCLVEGRRARDADETHDLLRRLGPLSLEELTTRSAPQATPPRPAPLPPTGSASGREDDLSCGQNGEFGGAGSRVAAWVEELVEARRAIRVGVGGEARVAAAEDAARLRDGLGVPVPPGLPAVFLEPVEHPLDQLVGRYARTTGPFHAADVARRLGAPLERVDQALARLADDGRVVLGEFRPGGSRREWCDAEVLRMLRRRSLAALRREVEPVDAVTLGRFLPAWHGLGRRQRGLDALLDAIGRLQGLALPGSVLEHDVLSTRVEGYRHADLDQLCSAGAVVWLGAGRLGASDGRVALYRRDQVALLAPPPLPDGERPDDEAHQALRDHLAVRGASFWPELLRATGRADERAVLDALWDLVWAGEVTNDGLTPLRAALEGPGRRRRRHGARPRPGSLSRLGPPAGAGRWSLVAPLLEPAPTPTERAHARAVALLERHGVVAREAVLAEGAEGGFAGVYGVLKAMEESGSVRRGYFVAGLGAAQFALPGAVDRLRSERTSVDADLPDGDGRGDGPLLTLAATDPANPYGAALPWPPSEGRPARAAGAYVVLVSGEAVAYLERGGHSLLTFPATAHSSAWVDGLVALVKDGRLRRLVIGRVDGVPVAESPVAEVLRAASFADGYRGLTLQ